MLPTKPRRSRLSISCGERANNSLQRKNGLRPFAAELMIR